ncbi:MAG: hypothetical protein ACE5EX_00615, partial [Phycisphaerae bacterium]
SGTPIAGSGVDFVDVPQGFIGTFASGPLPEGITLPVANVEKRIWMVVSGSQTGNRSPCRLGWIIGQTQPLTGNTAGRNLFGLQSDDDALDPLNTVDGGCCTDGTLCNAGTGPICPGDATGSRGFCSDGDAESAGFFAFSGTCWGDANDFCSNFVASVFAPATTTLSLIPQGNGPDGSLVPGATIRGNQIAMPSGGTTVFLEVRIGDWDPIDDRCVAGTNDGQPCTSDADCPDQLDPNGQFISDGTCGIKLRAYLAVIESAGYSSGLQGTLTPALVPCTVRADCAAAFGGACSESRGTCLTNADCPVPTESCVGPGCDFLSGVDLFCRPGSIATRRDDFVFDDPLTVVNIQTLDYGIGAATASEGAYDPDPFPPQGLYGGTVVLDVPPDVQGTFTVDLRQPGFGGSGMLDANGGDLPLLGFVPGKITVGFGQCCFDFAAGGQCVDSVTAAQCDAMPGPLGFRAGGSCGDPLTPCDCNGNAVFDGDDIASGTSPDCNANAVPDECDLAAGISPDCNRNDAPDECDVAAGTAIDCNGNGIPDACDLAAGTSPDCNGDGVPDECGPDCNENAIPDACDIRDGTSLDLDTNGVPDECECPPAAVRPDPAAIAKVRYLTIVPGNRGQQTAVRVTFAALPDQFASLDGQSMWVGPPVQVSGLGGSRDATPPTLTMARLQCHPFFTDWDAAGTIHVFHQNLIPSATYSVQAIDIGCDPADESGFSAPLVLFTSGWADLVGSFTGGSWNGPDGLVGIPSDAIAVLDAFVNRGTAPLKPRADLEPATPDQLINISDVTKVLFSFSGRPYPFPPDSNPCP